MSSSAHRHVITRAYLREIAQHFMLVLGGVLFLAALAAAVRASSTSQGAPLWISLSLLPLLVSNTLPYVIPVALMTAVVFCYGRMAADGETTALRTAGVAPATILRPAILAGLVVATISYPLSSQLIPKIYKQIRVLDHRMAAAALENTNPGSSGLHFRGLDLSWNRRAADGSFLDVVLTHQDSKANKAYAFDAHGQDKGSLQTKERMRLRADRATLDSGDGKMEFKLWGMRTISGANLDQANWSMRNQGPTVLRLDMDSIIGKVRMPEKGDPYTSSEMLASFSAPDSVSPTLYSNFRYSYWRRIITALTTIPMALLGALLGWRMRKSGMLGAFMGTFVVLLFLYYPLFLAADSVFRSGALIPELAAIIPLLGMSISCIILNRWQGA